MTAIMDREVIAAGQRAEAGAAAGRRRTAAGQDRRVATRARGLSPRLAGARAAAEAEGSITPSNTSWEGVVRTEGGAVRVTGARGAARRTVERPRVRPATRPAARGISRQGGCARRTPGPSALLCLALAVGAFLGVVLLFGGARSEPAPSVSARPALTSIVTVRAGQDLEQIAAEIAPGREAASVVAAISEINGLRDGRVRAGQTLITPRY